LGVLTGNIKQAYEQYVKSRVQQKAKLEGIVSQLKSGRMNWLDKRVDDMFPNGLDVDEEAAELEKKLHNFDPVRWGLYEAISGRGDVIVTIEAKTSWRPGKSPYSRHNPATYKVPYLFIYVCLCVGVGVSSWVCHYEKKMHIHYLL
jgi:hypothetical protein